jgi:shikimate kinase/3-dehydroquinate synthase
MINGGFGNLIVTGFMGTGKTTVAQEVARRLNRPFVDMDTQIEEQAGKSIPRIFAEDGEVAFRQMETALCTELSERQGLVIATGGGALVDARNRKRLMESGTVVCLTCDVSEIVRRLNGGDDFDRPLLHVADPRAEIERLLGVRHQAYAAIPWWVDTTQCSVDDVAARVIELSRVITLPVRCINGIHAASPTSLETAQTIANLSADLKYPVHIGRGLLAHVGGALRVTGIPEKGRVAVVSNPVTGPLYRNQVATALESAGFQPFFCSLPDGEQHKTLATVVTLYDQFLSGGLDRSGTVLALGGGVTGDIAGFAAASYMRGIRFVQIPTTLLAMVDASVGGKTGVDLPQGKNLVGAFKNPALVVMDPTVLKTLPRAEVRSGMAEVIKHGIIGAPDLFADLESGNGALDLWWDDRGPAQLARALRVKIAVVEQDPCEQGRRAVLNLGHTVGHALEKLSGFGLRHGEAVAVGMVAAARIAAQLGRAEPSLVQRITSVLEVWGLPTQCPCFSVDEIWEAMAHDKKRRGRELRWVLPYAIGEVEITQDVPPNVVKSVLCNMGARSI